ncbi:hypothetical protein LCGC14_1276620 [marine sediment metagenome]|uniref:Uncharacterized protein n=1 Tax=marine sediment metagenome TaxID=412755 RepID=A0A0F9ND25_9ZZZZ
MKHKRLRHVLSLLTNGKSFWILNSCTSEKMKTVLMRQIQNEIEKLKGLQ